MGEVKKNFWIIFLVLVLGVNFAFGQGAYIGEKEYVPFVNKVNIGECLEYYIPNFYYYYFETTGYNDPGTFCPSSLTSNIQTPYYDYLISKNINEPPPFVPAFGKLKLKNYDFTFDSNNPVIHLSYINSSTDTLKTINKIYIFKATTTFFSGLGWTGMGKGVRYLADKDNDLIDVISNLNWQNIGSNNFRDFSGSLNIILRNFSPYINIDGSQNPQGLLYGYAIPKQDFIFIAEGLDYSNNLRRRLIQNISFTTNRYFKFISVNELSVQLSSPLGFFNPDNFDNHLQFFLFHPDNVATTTQFYIKYKDKRTGQIVYDSGWIPLNLTNPSDGSLIDLNLTNYGLDLKTILQNLRNQQKTDLILNLFLNELTLDNQNIIIYNFGINYLLGGLTLTTLTYQDWYDQVIGSFGLTSASPTPIFQKSAEFIDNTFQSFQSFITIDNDKLNNLKTSIINNLNTFISYINGFTDALGFLKYLFYGLLVFTMIEFIVKFGRLIIPFK
jgi:hypothetical protein